MQTCRPEAMMETLSSAPDGRFSKAQEHTVVELKVEGDGDIFSPIPDAVGQRFETSMGGVLDASRAPGSMELRTNAKLASIFLAPSPNMQAAFAGNPIETFNAPVGMLMINPRNVDRVLRWESDKRNVAVVFSSQGYDELAAAELEGADWEIHPPRFGHVDREALRIARLMSAELANGPVNALYLQSLIVMMGVHLIRNYSGARSRASRAAKVRLAPATAKRISAYMREHLSRKLSIADLSKQAGLSQSHFLRAFSQTFGICPHRHLLNLRLQEAEMLLLQTDSPISEIAYETGFSSQSHLTSAMKRHKQITPAKLRGSM